LLPAAKLLFADRRHLEPLILSPRDSLTSTPYDLIATCAFGLEAIVRRELEGLGIDAKIQSSGRVHFQGDWETICKANLWLRTADRVLIRVAEFPAADFDALYDTTRDLNWAAWIPRDGQFPVTGRSIDSTLTSVPAVQRTVKKAVVESLKRDHLRDDLPETGCLFKLDVSLLKDIATLTIDSTGRSLHRRGYRTLISTAPLKETLAAAMVLLSYWRPGKPLLDPFCGTGTIPIEAAMIGRNLAPGLHRDFPFFDWPLFRRQIWDDLCSDAVARQTGPLEERLLGSDIDPRSLRAARENAERAGVENDIHFEPRDVREISSRRRFGCLITNPPYGSRIGADGQSYQSRDEIRALDDLYRTLPEVLRHFPTWSHYIFTSYADFEGVVGRQADRRRKLYNGRIECTYYQFHGPKPVVETRGQDDEAIVLVHADGPAAFGGVTEKGRHQAEIFAARLKKLARHLRRWPTKREITCFRLYERDVPEIPLVVDRYENHLHLSEYERPHDRDPAGHAAWLELMVQTAAQTLEVPIENTHFKSRSRQQGLTQHEKVNDTRNRFVVKEGGLKFLVNLDDYVDTGLFLDHRLTRAMVRDEAKGKDVLNLFAYTGSFSVYAADGAARSTTTVDLSKNYLDWATDNMKLNHFSGKEHRYFASDVPSFVRDHFEGQHYDLVILDPPTYSNSKRTQQDWDVQKDAVPLIRQVLKLMRPDGVIYFSTNFRRFKFDPALVPEATIREISQKTVPEDFRNRRIHRCWRIVKSIPQSNSTSDWQSKPETQSTIQK
jgi:23S rRNA (guanine2445-N2)-methyltransferase / 23S rRNA (guanine2069-N7)-methyltransferase